MLFMTWNLWNLSKDFEISYKILEVAGPSLILCYDGLQKKSVDVATWTEVGDHVNLEEKGPCNWGSESSLFNISNMAVIYDSHHKISAHS